MNGVGPGHLSLPSTNHSNPKLLCSGPMISLSTQSTKTSHILFEKEQRDKLPNYNIKS